MLPPAFRQGLADALADAPGVGITITCPTAMLFAFLIDGLAARTSATVTLNLLAIRVSVSPFATM